MNKSSNLANPATINRSIRFLVSFLLFLFLTGLGHAVLRDLGKINAPTLAPEYSQQTEQLKQELASLHKQDQLLNQKKRDVHQTKTYLRQQTQLSDDDFSTLLRADASLHQFNVENPIFAQIQDMQEYRKQVKQVMVEERDLQIQGNHLADQITAKTEILNKINELSSNQYQKDSAKHTLKAFMWRLLLTLPILGSGIYFFIKYRTHKYSPLVWGYAWFALYVFFFGLVPYLPDFGGYVRYGIGVIGTLLGGKYAINYAQSYAEKRKKELEESSDLKKNLVEFSKAQKNLQKKLCPACDAPWEIQALGEKYPAYCGSCGIPLFKTCSCGTQVYSFMPYCHTCGKRQDVSLN